MTYKTKCNLNKLNKVFRNGSLENASNGSSENSSNGSSENSSNGNVENSSMSKLQKIVSEDIAWDASVAKQFILLYWIKLNIQEKEGSFITTRDIYEKYRQNCTALNEKSVLPEASFYRLIWNSLLTAKIMYVKSQEDGKKGIRGIQFKSTENYSKKIYNGQEIVP